ncbi:MAG TPA: hypothetical protein VF189_06690 [Patescibacteria group bacterium]
MKLLSIRIRKDLDHVDETLVLYQKHTVTARGGDKIDITYQTC